MRWEGGTASPWGQVVLLGRERKNDKLERGGGGLVKLGCTGGHWGGFRAPPEAKHAEAGTRALGWGKCSTLHPSMAGGRKGLKKGNFGVWGGGIGVRGGGGLG